MDYIQKSLSLEQQRLQESEALNKERLANYQVTLREYLDAEVQNNKDVMAAQLLAIDQQESAAEASMQWTPKLGQEFEARRKAATQKSTFGLTQLGEKAPGMALQDVTGRFGLETKSLENQISFQEKNPSATFDTTTLDLARKLTETLDREMARLQELARQTDSVANPKTWIQIYDQIQHIAQAQDNWNEKLREMASLVTQLAPGFTAIGQSISQNIRTKFGQNLGSNVSAGAKSLTDSQKLAEQISGTPVEDPRLKALQDQAASIFAKLEPGTNDLTGAFTTATTTFQTVTDQATQFGMALAKITGILNGPGTGPGTAEQGGAGGELPNSGFRYSGGYGKAFDSSSKIPQFTSQLVGAITAVDSFTNSILNSKSVLSGLVGGGVGGAGLGNTLGQLNLPGIGAIGGPLGSAIGMAVGAALGGIIGAKEQQVKDNINSLNTQFANMNQQFALNTNNLNAQIQALGDLMAQARAMQASSKKGSSQYQQVIDQYIQQINQLNVQQQQTIRQMNQQVAILTEPQGAQSFLNTIQQIVQTYQQFEGAAQNANELATANQFLTLSLQQYTTTLEQQLDQDNQQAIQDALQLNDLLYQRQQMILQYNDQVQSVLSQGVLTRQRTRAESAGEQVQQLTVQYQMQLAATNEEISATQFRW